MCGLEFTTFTPPFIVSSPKQTRRIVFPVSHSRPRKPSLFDRQFQETISNPLYKSEMWWSNGQCTGLWVKRSGFKTWPVHVLCSRARHYALTVSLSTQKNKWVLAKCQGSLMKCRRVTLGWTSTPSREGVVILLFTSCDMETRFSSGWVDLWVECRLNLMV